MNIFWLRRDLRLIDNTALNAALNSGEKVQPIFIFDTQIINELEDDDPRITFIYEQLEKIHFELLTYGSSLKVFFGNPTMIWQEIVNKVTVDGVYVNKDYEPYGINRDFSIKKDLLKKHIPFYSFKDQVIFEEDEILKKDGTPYTVYTPFKNKWLEKFKESHIKSSEVTNVTQFLKSNYVFPSMEDLGFVESKIKVPEYNSSFVPDYEETRNFPALDKTSKIGPHLRFGTLSIRTIVNDVKNKSKTYLNELIWREFFMQILWHFPKVVHNNFKSKYNGIEWRNNQEEFIKWCKGKTGYPIVDAGMRELNETGFMHNRVRMVVASFLCKHLLIDWRWGEAYFAKKLLDYELSSNNGNWQWSAGTGCDAAPYFRVFSPHQQTIKFDSSHKYIKKWVKDINELTYPHPMVDHAQARKRALETYKTGLMNLIT